ncbi:MAG: putative LPS assembly protein LptD [Acidobacteriota bacterium]
MIRRLPAAVACCLLLTPLAAAAQVIPGWNARQFTIERLDEDRLRLAREVDIEGDPSGPNAGQRIFADEVQWNLRTGEFIAVGNVVVSSPTARISAERVVFNTRAGTGVFESASGIVSIAERITAEERSMFGTLEPDMYFYGETIEKLGENRYRIRNGAFTTCVQPTPRWEVVTTSATINVGDYAILRNAVMRVKDVPVFYLPVLYYPIQDDDRATGFLLPSYGSQTYQGQSLSNAFFWAINRSQDVTLFHDWYFSTGQGAGSEYRYVAGPGSEGQLRAYWLNEREAERNFGGGAITTPARRAYEIRGSLAQQLPGGLRARGRVDYFSDIATQQLYNYNVFQATNRQREVNGSVSGTWGGLSVTGNFQRRELFFNDTDSVVSGQAPGVMANLSSRRIAGLPVYVSLTSEAGRLLLMERRGPASAPVELDRSLGRVDILPSVRAPLTNWPFLTVTAQLSYRMTYFTQSLNENNEQVAEPLARRYADMRADVIGPVFSRVFNPNNAFADRLKHIIEPNFSVSRLTAIENQDRVTTAVNSSDAVVGAATRLNYGLTNRFLVRKAPAGTTPGSQPQGGAPREFLTVGVTQSYYTDERINLIDQQFQSSLGPRPPSRFSPVAVSVRAQPTDVSNATLRLEYDPREFFLQGLSASGGVNYPRTQASIGWSRQRIAADRHNNAMNGSTTLKFRDGRIGGTYSFDWNIATGTLIQQRWIGYLNAQCCGLAVEYQEYNYGTAAPGFPPRNRRFNLSFSLAGIGTFSNFFGSFGGSRF